MLFNDRRCRRHHTVSHDYIDVAVLLYYYCVEDVQTRELLFVSVCAAIRGGFGLSRRGR